MITINLLCACSSQENKGEQKSVVYLFNILHLVSHICLLHMHTHCLICFTHTACQSKLKPFSHFRLAETDKKRNLPFLTEVTQAAAQLHRPQTALSNLRKAHRLHKIFTENLGNIFRDLTEAQETPSFHFSKPWTEEPDGIVFQSVCVSERMCVTAWEKARKS